MLVWWVRAASAVGVCHDRAVASHQAAGVHIQLSEEKEQIVRCALILFTDLKRHTRGERERESASGRSSAESIIVVHMIYICLHAAYSTN